MTVCQVARICHIQGPLHSHDGHKVAAHMQDVKQEQAGAPQLQPGVENETSGEPRVCDATIVGSKDGTVA